MSGNSGAISKGHQPEVIVQLRDCCQIILGVIARAVLAQVDHELRRLTKVMRQLIITIKSTSPNYLHEAGWQTRWRAAAREQSAEQHTQADSALPGPDRSPTAPHRSTISQPTAGCTKDIVREFKKRMESPCPSQPVDAEPHQRRFADVFWTTQHHRRAAFSLCKDRGTIAVRQSTPPTIKTCSYINADALDKVRAKRPATGRSIDEHQLTRAVLPSSHTSSSRGTVCDPQRPRRPSAALECP